MKTVEERFWSKVSKTDNCWNWTASVRGANGYGFFRISKEIGCTTAHRFSYELKNGKIPDGMLVCHSCDNPLCVNPDHLFLGTHKDNARDRERKGRGYTPFTKLTAKQVKKIKSSSQSQSKLAKLFGVSRQTIANIQYGQTWKSISKKEEAQTKNCAICCEQYEHIIHKDMNYQYRKISDDLCLKCNKALKLFNNSTKMLQAAISYLDGDSSSLTTISA